MSPVLVNPFALASGGSPAVVQHRVFSGSLNTAVGFVPTAGDIVVLAYTSGTPRNSTAVSGMGATWVKVFDGTHTDFWIGTGATTSGTVTVTSSGAESVLRIGIWVVRSLTSSAATGQQATTTGTSLAGPSASAGAGQFVVSAGLSWASTGCTFPSAQTPAAGWTNQTVVAGSNRSFGYADRVPSSTETHHTDMTSATSVTLATATLVVG